MDDDVMVDGAADVPEHMQRVGSLIPQALRGAGATSIEFGEHPGVVFDVEDDVVVGVHDDAEDDEAE